jgi:Rrf2 family transcriptional regulator, cysteine metabolism repressor
MVTGMKLSTKSQYACLAMVELARNYNQGVMKIQVIAERQGIPKKYLEQILLLLKSARYVRSRKGSEGGYELVKPPSEISIAEVVRLTDGALAPVGSVSRYFFEHTPLEKNSKLIAVFKDIRDYISEKMEQTTFAELV